MPSPFPGMDPWLEDRDVWPGVHSRLINNSSDQLQPQLRELGYFVDVEEHIYIEESDRFVVPDLVIIERNVPRENRGGTALMEMEADVPLRLRRLPAVETRVRSLQVFDAKGRVLVTQIEFISHANKRSKSGRKQYRQKRKELRQAGVNFVEIDLLRAGKPLVDLSEAGLENSKPWDYLVNVTRSGQEECEVYPIPLQSRLPRIRIPLRPDSPDAVLDIQAAFDRVYDSGPYPDRLDYNQPPKPTLSEDDAAWAERLLSRSGARQAHKD